MIDVKQNNYLLPLKGDEPVEPDFVKGLGLVARIKIERAPIFNELAGSFYQKHFDNMTVKRLGKEMRVLGLTPQATKTKAQAVGILTKYYTNKLFGAN